MMDSLRLVNVSDVDEAMRMKLREWRNSDQVSPFFLLDQVSADQHAAWMLKNIRGEDACAYVIYADGTPLGLVYLPWFDQASHCGEIGIYIYDQSYRERHPAGFAYDGLMAIAATELGLHELSARILEDNVKSIRFHERHGFSLSPEVPAECVKGGEIRRVFTFVKEL